MKTCFFLICLFIVSSSCKQNSNRSISAEQGESQKNTIHLADTTGWVDTVYDKNGRIDEILRGRKNGKKYLEGACETYYPSGVLKTVKYFHNDTARGSFLEFYPNGRLQRFSYLINNEYNVYYRDYDSSGKLMLEEGNPYVDHDINENSSHDTVHLVIFLSDYGFRSLDLYVSPNGEKFTKMGSNARTDDGTKVFKMWKRTAGLNHVSFYMKIIGLDSVGNEHFYRDTLSLKR